MALKLIPPGKRRGNRFYLARGRIGGQLYEVSTRTTDKETAERIAAQLAAKVLEDRPAEQQEVEGPKTFRFAAAAYCDYRAPAHRDIQIINRLVKVLGEKPCQSIGQADLVAAAKQLYPDHKPSSLNRLVITPASAILHYARDNRWCADLRIRRFKEPTPETRAMRQPDVDLLLGAAADPHIRAMLDVLFCQGPRISDALMLAWERLDLTAGAYLARVGKTDQWRWKALHPQVQASLACLPGERVGRVFPWVNRWAFYKALRPALAASGVRFTPHMARHTLGFRLGLASLKTRMDIMDHADPKSSMRYDMSQIEEQRAALQLVGESPLPTKKAV